jgi:hypothetical protein
MFSILLYLYLTRLVLCRWIEFTRIKRLLCDTILRMLEVSRLNRTHVSSQRIRACWNRWHQIVSAQNDQVKACRMIVQCYRKILRTAVFTWRKNGDAVFNLQKMRTMTLTKIMQMTKLNGLRRFYDWKLVAQEMRTEEEHVNRLGVVLKRLKTIRRQRRAWGAWKTLFLKVNSPTVSNGATLRLYGTKYVNAVTRAQYWSSKLLRHVVTCTSVEPVLELAVQALQSVLPQFTPSLYYLHHDHAYLWGNEVYRSGRRAHSPQHGGGGASAAPTPMSATATAAALHQLQQSRQSPTSSRYLQQQQDAYFSSIDGAAGGRSAAGPMGTPNSHHRGHHILPVPIPMQMPAPPTGPFSPAGASMPYSPYAPSVSSAAAGGGGRGVGGGAAGRHHPPYASPYTPRTPFAHHPRHHQGTAGNANLSASASASASVLGAGSGCTVLLGEGIVGRCAEQRCLQVFRHGVVTDGVHSQPRSYCSMFIPVPEHSFNINGTGTACHMCYAVHHTLQMYSFCYVFVFAMFLFIFMFLCIICIVSFARG